MKIGLSAEWIGTHAGGPEVYQSNLIESLLSLDNENEYHIYLSERSVMQRYQGRGRRVIPRLMFGKSRWIVIPISQPLGMITKPVDLFHATFIAPPLCPAPFVMTITELGFERYPEFYPRSMRLRIEQLVRSGSKRALQLLSISEYTKNDLIEIYHIDPDRITVTYCGVSDRFRPIKDKKIIADVLKQYGIHDEYILYVGKLEIRKNVDRLLQAYHKLKNETDHEHKLVIVGDKSYLYDHIFETMDRLKLHNDVYILEKVVRSHLPAFYNGASVFVFPSLMEAFGIPPIEAMACGIPVVASNVTAVPEITGDAAVHVDPYNVYSIADGILKVLNDEPLRRDLIVKGFERAKFFSWEETAQRTIDVYKAVG